MKDPIRMLSLMLSVGLVAGVASVGSASPPRFARKGEERQRRDRASRASKEERIDALLAPWSQQGMPGAAVLVIQDGKVVLKKGYGLADLEAKTRIGPATSFRLASLTKQFAAMAIMILAERGKLRYEDRLSRFFPQFPFYAQASTVEHLLHHTAGLREYGDIYEGIVGRRRRGRWKGRGPPAGNPEHQLGYPDGDGTETGGCGGDLQVEGL